MSFTEKDDQLIDKYLRSQLDAEEEKLFVEKQKDVDFQKELELRKNSLVVIKKSGREDLKKRLQHLEKDIQGVAEPVEQTSRFKINPFKKLAWLSVAATLLLLFGLFWWNTSTVNSDELFAQHFEPYPNVIAPIVKSQTPSATEYELAFQKYEQGEYQTAIPLLEKIETEEGRFYLAIALLENKKEEQAISILSDLTQTSSNRFYEASQWYLALAFLKLNQVDKSNENLNLILKNSQHNFYKQAVALKKKMK